MTKNQIEKLRKKGLTFQAIGKLQKPKVTAERIRQILNPVQMIRCKKHDVLYEKYCKYCKIEMFYSKTLAKTLLGGTLAAKKEFERLSHRNRTKVVVIQRAMLIKALHDVEGVPLSMIAKVLHRDLTSIVNLYKKKL